ncbi:Glycosyl transferase family 2 [Roseovarius tolerans]|uniref:Glycosyl transferase family 2 n=1 Tax=Roseovarius tolerans TaxID=74031 RepID=A0A1H8JC39_9RHOB|nr:glycosyltransferase family A protein [Roseovarius tolerans]SEN77886.1 Glycosyl transferase family 2 [Roseovarius tolerans]
MTHIHSSTQDPCARQPGLCSVVCTTYNHAKYARAAIESIVAQDYRPLEIIVIDDGSTDDNVAVIEAALSESDVQSTLITQQNTANIAGNVNRALAAATGDFVLPTSLDDLLLPGCISSKMALLLEDQSLVMVGNSSMSEMDMSGKITRPEVRNPVFGHETASCHDLLEIEFATAGSFFTQGTVLRADCVEAIGGYDEDIAGDDLILRTKLWKHLIANSCLRCVFLRDPGFVYRKHDENLHRNTLRQLRTLIDWHNRFFPERPLPAIVTRRARNYFSECLANRDDAALQQALDLGPFMADLYSAYRYSWGYYRRSTKHALRRVFLPTRR